MIEAGSSVPFSDYIPTLHTGTGIAAAELGILAGADRVESPAAPAKIGLPHSDRERGIVTAVRLQLQILVGLPQARFHAAFSPALLGRAGPPLGASSRGRHEFDPAIEGGLLPREKNDPQQAAAAYGEQENHSREDDGRLHGSDLIPGLPVHCVLGDSDHPRFRRPTRPRPHRERRQVASPRRSIVRAPRIVDGQSR